MQVINKKLIVIFICLGIFIFGLFKLFNKKDTKLDEVKLDIRDTNNSFAIYVEQSDGNYEESESKEFPKGYKYNYIKSNCTGIDGNIVNGVLDYNNETGIATVDTSDSLNCYLYFDKGAGLEIIGKEPKGLNLETTSDSDEWTGMYRFQGQQSEGIENYICFGTSDQNECKAHPDKYMYRIIGIEESGRIKVIKKEALEETDQWWTDDATSKQWSESLIFEHINNTTFLNNEELVPKGWEDKIDNNNWLFGSMHNTNVTYGAKQNGVEVYKIESGQKEAQWYEKANSLEDEYKGIIAQSSISSSGAIYYYITHTEKWSETELLHEVNAKIGLINLSDYYLSVGNDGNCNSGGNYSECLTGWMHLTKNDNKKSKQVEWTMTSYGLATFRDGLIDAYAIFTSGNVAHVEMNKQYLVRPAFYLKSNNMLKEGSGTEEDPFVIEDVTYEGEPKGLIEFASKGLNITTTSDSEDWTGMYRYQGQQSEGIENYICFGTSDKNECLKNQDKYMYRIIGIEESGRIKVIKKEALKDGDQWWSDYDTNVYWNESLIFGHINGEKFLNNKELVPNDWEDKIDNNNWLFGSINDNLVNSTKQSGIEVYKIESGEKETVWYEKAEEGESYKGVQAKLYKTPDGPYKDREFYYIEHTEKWSETIIPHEVNAKIGIINMSDYYLSVNNDVNCYNNTSCSISWMHLLQNDNNPPINDEYTMTRLGWNINRSRYGVIVILSSIGISPSLANGSLSIRPVFFLKNDIKIVDGNGKSDEPFIIN